ncbi:CE162 protein, partial [Crypturellus soui]|nr:CE162 protein [Crypturellus soui]
QSLSDDSLGSSKKYSILETLGQPRKKEAKKKDSAPWWISEEDSDDGGMLRSSGSFVRLPRTAQPAGEAEEDALAEQGPFPRSSGMSVSASRDSLETHDSIVTSGPNQSILGAGLDTLEEQEEKEKFFAKLEQEASSTIDYSRLNKELDSNDSVILAPFVRNEKNEKGEEESAHEEKSGSYSEDFEEETDVNPAFKTEENQRILMAFFFHLIVLLDSQDSTIEVQKVAETSDVGEQCLPEEVTGIAMNETGPSYGQASSDVEALHEAYRHVHQSWEDTEEHKAHAAPGTAPQCAVPGASQNNDICSKHVSTTESDLPTVEELMKPIKGDSYNARGFNLEPGSPVERGSPAKELIGHEPFKERQSNTVWETDLLEKFSREGSLSLQRAVNEGNLQGATEKEAETDEIQPGSMKEKMIQDSLFSQLVSKNNQVALQSPSSKGERLGSLTTKQTYRSIRSTTPLHKKKSSHSPRGLVRSSGYGKSALLSKQPSPSSEKKTLKETFKKSSPKPKSPADKAGPKGLFATRIIRSAPKEVALKEGINKVVPGDSAVGDGVQQVMDSHSQDQHDSPFPPVRRCERELYLLRRAQAAEEELSAARGVIEQLSCRASRAEQDAEAKVVQLKAQQDRELSQLGQENYLLQSKLRSMEELAKGRRWIHDTATVPVTEEKLTQIKKEIEDQEVIIQGYQQENEKLYKQMKELQIQNKKNEEQMFKENQCLMSELIALREKVNMTNMQPQVMQVPEPTRNQSFTELISELRAAQKEETKLHEEIKRLKQEKQALEVDLGQAKRERDLAKGQIASTSGEKLYEFKIMEDSYKQEIAHLKRRLQWYAENQDLLDKDAARLKDAKEEIEKLKLEVEKLRTEAGDQCIQQKKRQRDRAADAKRIQDLERQIKEMEGILKRRYPNSLPALIYAAAAAEKSNDLSAKTNTIDFLERRIKKLETELESKDDEAKKSLRAMEQQFQKIKVQYEQRLVELEQLLAYKFMSESPKLSRNKASFTELEQELQNLKEIHQVTVKNLQSEIENLKSQNSQLSLGSKKESKDLQSTDSQVKQANTKERLLKLNQELVTKNREIQNLTKTVEKLQKERMVMLSDDNFRNKAADKENSRETLKQNSLAGGARAPGRSEPSAGAFPGGGECRPQGSPDAAILEVLQENKRLKDDLERLSLEMNQQRIKSQATLAYSENNIRRMQEETAEYVASLKAAHERELERLLRQPAAAPCAARVAELHSRISTQEVLIKHLQEQISEQQRQQEALLVSQMREELLQKEVAKLSEELREAKERQSPEMKQFLCLEQKIKHMESRRAEREQELQKAARLAQQHVGDARQGREAERWRRLAQRKNRDLEAFRAQLDSMLDVLRELQRQGVVIPAPSSGGAGLTDGCWRT